MTEGNVIKGERSGQIRKRQDMKSGGKEKTGGRQAMCRLEKGRCLKK